MQSVCTHPALGLRHDMVSISYGIGEVAGDFVRDAAASGKRDGSNSNKTPCFCCFWFSLLFDLVSWLRFVEQLIFMILYYTSLSCFVCRTVSDF